MATEGSPKTLLSRQWSASTLLRGNSYLLEQHTRNQSLSFDDLIHVPKLHDLVRS